MIVFRGADGRTLFLEDLNNVSGTYQYEIIGSEAVPVEANELHQKAREAGRIGDYPAAIALLKEATERAPRWPFPEYDMAFTYLLMKDFESAKIHYMKTVELAPRGFFTAITALDILTREKVGEFQQGTYLGYLSLEWIDDHDERVRLTKDIVAVQPSFAPAWKDLAGFAEKDSEQLAAIERGLKSNPDAETYGILVINKALVLDRQGNHSGAVQMLGELALSKQSTFATEHLAKATLALIIDE